MDRQVVVHKRVQCRRALHGTERSMTRARLLLGTDGSVAQLPSAVTDGYPTLFWQALSTHDGKLPLAGQTPPCQQSQRQ